MSQLTATDGMTTIQSQLRLQYILPTMQRFRTARDAKEYLIDRIVNQASRDGVSLTGMERKMLYFSETDWMLPDMMQVNSEFDRHYDDDAYERKITGLVHRIREGDGDQRSWEEAVRRLRSEDHYLLVLIDGVSQPRASGPKGDLLRLILTACVIIAVFFPVMFLFDSKVPDKHVVKGLSALTFVILVTGATYLNRRASR